MPGNDPYPPVVTLKIDGESVTAPTGTSIIEATRAAGIAVPTICWDPRIEPIGSCRLCLVEIQGYDELVTACQTEAKEGMWVTTHNAELDAYRRTELGWYAEHASAEDLIAHPDKELHRLMARFGIESAGCASPAKAIDASMPQIRVDMAKCIDCLRCVQICEEVQGASVWHEVGRGDESRIVPKHGDLLSEGACVACGACTDTCPTTALTDAGAMPADSWTRTTCPYCGVGCELDIGVAGDHIVAARPARDAPVNKGHACSKGRYAFGFTHSGDRQTQPLVRKGRAWEPASWDEALDHCAAQLAEVIGRHGPDAIGVLASSRSTNEDSYVAQKFARLAIGTNNIDCCARVCHTPTAAAMKAILGAGAATNSFDDIERASTILVAGANPSECHPVVGARIRRHVVANGAKLIVLDPRAQSLSEIASVHLALKPGTDIPLFNALAHHIIASDLADKDFIAARLDEFDAFAAHVAQFPPDRVADICELDAADIRRAAEIYAGGGPAYAAHGLGLTEHVQGTEAVMTLVNLALVTGNVGGPGRGVNPLRGQNNVQGTAHMGCDPGILTGAVALEEARGDFERAWGAELPKTPGRHLMKMIDAAAAGELKALVVIGYDILASLADEHETAKALAKLDCVIVIDLFMTRTAHEYGHVLLPAASSFEKEGTFMNAERRIQRVRKVTQAPGAARADWDILCALARRMGCETGFDFADPQAIWDEIRAVWPAAGGIAYSRLEAGGIQWPCRGESDPGTEVLHASEFGHGPRARLRPIHYHPTTERTDADYPFLMSTGRNLYQFNVATMSGRSANALMRPTDTLDLAPADAARLALTDGELAQVESRYGSAILPVAIDERVVEGRAFATFHDTERAINRVTGPHRDRMVGAPEYKVTAVRIRPV
jgi:formate dehydrogenase major subunit